MMLNLQKIIAVAMLTLKSYYLKTSKGVSLLILPLLMILVFLLQDGDHGKSENIRLIVNSMVLVTCFTSINILSNNISCDLFFKRMKLYKASNISYYIYMGGILLPLILSTTLAQILILLISSIFFEIILVEINILKFLTISFLSTVSLSFVGVYIGFYTKDLVASHTISNLASAGIAFFSGTLFPISNLIYPLLIGFAKFIPSTHSNFLFANCFSKSFGISINDTHFVNDIIMLLLYSLLSVFIIMVKNLWVSQDR